MKKLNIYLVISFISFISNFFSQNAVLTKSPGVTSNSTVKIGFSYKKSLFYGEPISYSNGNVDYENQSIRKLSVNDLTDIDQKSKDFSYFDQGLGSTILNDNVFILQGNSFYKYNIVAKSRTNLQSFPSAFTKGRSCILNDGSNYIYVLGGFKDYSGVNNISNELWRYDISNNLWSLLSNCPVPLAMNSGAYIYPYIYFGGGYSGYDYNFGAKDNNKLYSYNLLTNSWSLINTSFINKTTISSVQNEAYFVSKGLLRCYLGKNEGLGMSNQEIWTYDNILNKWSSIKVNQYEGGVFTNATTDNFSGTDHDYISVYPLDDDNFIICEDNTGFKPIFKKSFYLSTLSLINKQVHVKINKTDCVDTISATSLNIDYSIQFSGVFSNCIIDVIVNDNQGNSKIIRSLNNISLNGQQVLNFKDAIDIKYKSGNISISINQGGEKSKSINEYPIRNSINQVVIDEIKSSNGTVFCNNSLIGTVLNVTQVSGRKYQWYINGNLINGQTSNVYTASSKGAYSCLITNNTGCTYEAKINLSTVPNPLANLYIDGSKQICQNESTILKTDSMLDYNYQWFYNGSQILNANFSKINVSKGGLYYVKVNNGNCSSISTNQEIILNSLPIISGNTTICDGVSSILKSSDVPSTTNPWVSSNLNIASIDNKGVISPKSIGSCSITFTNSSGCSNTIPINILEKPKLNVGLDLPNICQGSKSISMGGSISGNATGGFWSGGLGVWENATNPNTAKYIASSNENGSITLTLTSIGGNCTISESKTIFVTPKPNKPSNTNCWDNYEFNSTTCTWVNMGTQPSQPSNINCWDNYKFNTTTCAWVNNGSQPNMPPKVNCWDNYEFNPTTCSWVNKGTQPNKPPKVNCWDDYQFNSTSCTWVNTGNQTNKPSKVNCWDNYEFNTTSCAWVNNGNQPGQPSNVNCWDNYEFNSTTCSWVNKGTKPNKPTNSNCWDNYEFNTTTCAWVNNGSQPNMPPNVNCWDNYEFNSTTCSWVNKGTQPNKPPKVNCWDDYQFNSTSCTWVNNGIQPSQPSIVNCWDNYEFNSTSCSWVNKGTKPNKPSNINCWDNYEFNPITCSWVNMGTQPSQPALVNCWDNYEFNTTSCSWVNTGTQPNKPSKINCWDEYLFNNSTCSWNLTGVKPSILGDLTICEGSSSLIKSSDIPSTINPWVISDISIATVSDNGLLKGLKAGTTVITYTNSLNCLVNSVVNILKSPNKPIISSNGNTSFCSGDSILLISSYNKGNLWSNNSINSSIYVSENGVYSLVFEDVNGCKSESEPITVKVLPLPNVKIFSSGSTNLCDGDKLTLSSSFSNGYLWSNASTNQSIIIDKSGKYYVTVIGQNGCSSTSDTVEVHFNQPSTSSIDIIGDDSVFVNEIKYITSGIYYQNFKNKNGCDSTIQVNVKINKTNLGLMELDLTNICYPNPVTDLLVIYNENKRFKSFIIEDLSGKKITQGYLNVNENYIDLKNISPGCYNLIFNEQNKPVRLIKN